MYDKTPALADFHPSAYPSNSSTGSSKFVLHGSIAVFFLPSTKYDDISEFLSVIDTLVEPLSDYTRLVVGDNTTVIAVQTQYTQLIDKITEALADFARLHFLDSIPWLASDKPKVALA